MQTTFKTYKQELDQEIIKTDTGLSSSYRPLLVLSFYLSPYLHYLFFLSFSVILPVLSLLFIFL